MIFQVKINKDRDSDYGVTVLGLPGCFSAGETLDKALLHTEEAIKLHLEEEFDEVDNLEIKLVIANYNEQAHKED